jgi:hypothetical protein
MNTPAAAAGDSIRSSGRRPTSAAAAGARLRTSLLTVALLALLAYSAEAQCPQGWDISGVWDLQQSNQAEPNKMTLGVHANGDIQGTASYRKASTRVQGIVSGNLNGDLVIIQIKWKNGLTGVYRGTIGSRGKLQGTAYEKGSPTVMVSWHSSRPMICRRPPKPGMGLPPEPSPTPAQAGSPPVAPMRAPPFIAADPLAPRRPAGGSLATTTLTWDAGKDHPYAEVWAKVNNAPEYFLVEKGKGTQSVNVMPGNTYTYILTDSGQQLATVIVKPQL